MKHRLNTFKIHTYHLLLMASHFPKLLFFLSLLTITSSGTFVGFSYDARRNSAAPPVIKAVSFLKKNSVSPSLIRIFVEDYSLFDSISNTGVSVDLHINETQARNLQRSKFLAITWLRTHLLDFTPQVNISSIVISAPSLAEKELPLLLPTLKSIHLGLKSLNLDHLVKVSVEIQLSSLESSDVLSSKYLNRVLEFVKKWNSSIVVESVVEGALSLGHRFIESAAEKAAHLASIFHSVDTSVVLNVKSSCVPSAIEVAQFPEKMAKALGNHAQFIDRIDGLLVEISPMEESEEKELKREEEEIFSFSHRELLNNERPISAAKTTTEHDSINPPTFIPTTPTTNPVTTPVTVPSTPMPTVITVPATNPTSVLPTLPPITPSVSSPDTIPISTPVITVPSSNPQTPPSSVPITVPETPPVTNPVTTYPTAPPGGTPTTTPVILPIPPPATSSPVVSGQSWCVAKPDAADAALQAALDYACGIGGADCASIQQTGSCYNPSTLHDHASFAFNSYYQKYPAPTSCDFGGNAMVVNSNPSSGTCIYPSLSSGSSMPSSTSSPSSSSVLNSNSPDTSSTIFSPQPPSGVSSSLSVLVNEQLLIILTTLTTYLIMGSHLQHA